MRHLAASSLRRSAILVICLPLVVFQHAVPALQDLRATLDRTDVIDFNQTIEENGIRVGVAGHGLMCSAQRPAPPGGGGGGHAGPWKVASQTYGRTASLPGVQETVHKLHHLPSRLGCQNHRRTSAGCKLRHGARGAGDSIQGRARAGGSHVPDRDRGHEAAVHGRLQPSSRSPPVCR